MIKRSTRSRRDILDHYVYIKEYNPDSAKRFLELTEETFKKLEMMPEMGHHWLATELDLKDVRVWPLVPTFKKYLIFYRPAKKE